MSTFESGEGNEDLMAESLRICDEILEDESNLFNTIETI